MLKKGKVYVPKNKSLRLEVIQLHHNMPTVGYKRQWNIVELVTRNYWWPEVTKKMK